MIIIVFEIYVDMLLKMIKYKMQQTLLSRMISK